MHGFALVTAPSAPPIELELAKQHLRIDETSYDDLLELYIAAAVNYIDGRDGILGIALMTQTWDLKLDSFPCDGVIELPLTPLQSVTSVTYTDTAGATQTWSAGNYQIDTARRRPRIVPAYNATLPSLRGGSQINQVTVRAVYGYGDEPASVPARIRAALLLHVTHLYERREPVIVGNLNVNQIPMGYRDLLANAGLPAIA